MQTVAIAGASATPAAAIAARGSSTTTGATSAFGLSFDALLKIVLTQLTYQDPLKPMDNYQFVSQLAQFSQIQIGQATNDALNTLVASQGTSQAAGLLGKDVDVTAGYGIISGTVTAIAFDNGTPQVTIQTAGGQTISRLSMSDISQIREAN